MPVSNGRKYRFKYLWSLQGKGKRLAPEESGKSWNFYLAEDDWSIKMPVGVHSAVASFRPVAQRLYGAIMTQPEYLNEFRFEVRPGLNVFVVNYVFHRDNPAIFIKRLVLSDTDDPLKRKTIISMQETSAGY